ncbi:MAG: ATP-binding protein [Gammaproteobacteria bacterium]|nr:ATP-binding protein [Gammaproteobacteria bacterium]
MNNWSIRQRIMLLALLPVFILAVLLSSYLITTKLRELERTLNEHGRAIARQMAPAFEYGVISGNVNVLNTLAAGALREEDVVSVVVRDAEDRVLLVEGKYAAKEFAFVRTQDNLTEFLSADGDSLMFRVPIFQAPLQIEDFEEKGAEAEVQVYTDSEQPSPTIVGAVEVELSRSAMLSQRTTVFVNGIGLALLCFIGAAVFALWMSRSIVGPITALTRVVENIAAGELGARAEVSSGAELGTLETGVNQMVSTLEANRDQLEQRITDATSQLRSALSALEVSEANYRDLFENSTDIVVTYDLQGKITSANHAVERVLGYTRDEALSMNWRILVAPSHRRKAVDLLRQLTGGERHLEFELDMLRKDGTVCTLEMGSRPIVHDGKVVGVHGTARDITRRIEFENALVEARKAAEEASMAKSNFVARMSHEVRTPITGIIGFLDLLTHTDLTQQQREFLELVRVSAERLTTIVNDALNFAQIEAGEMEIQNEPFALYQTVCQSVELLRPVAQSKKLDLMVQFSNDVPAHLYGDATRVSQVVLNLVNNAVKFTESGSVSVDVSNRSREADQVVIDIAVTDTGIGIPQDKVTQLFAPFQQIDDARTRKFEGTGLGLTITKHLVELMGGSLRIESRPNKGSRFVAQMPFVVATTSKENIPDQQEPTAANIEMIAPVSVLVVDDNDIVRRYFAAILRQFNIENVILDNARDAIDQCSRHKFDLVLMDIHMPEMDGMEAVKQIRKRHGDSTTVIVALTADAVSDSREKIMQSGFDDFLAKPLARSELIQTLVKWVPNKILTIQANTRKSTQAASGEVLDRTRGLELAGGDEKLWLSSVDLVKQQLPEQMKLIQHALDSEEFVEAGEIAHKIAGSASYIAASGLRAAVVLFEQAAKSKDAGLIEQQMQDLMLAVSELYDYPILSDSA